MAAKLKALFFTRSLICVVVANFIALVVLNFFEMRSFALAFVYLPSFFIAWVLLKKISFSDLTLEPDHFSVGIAFLALFFLTVPRLLYFLEWIPGNLVFACFDDYARLAELISMTLSDHYPLKHPANSNYLLSFYYAGLYPMALVKFIIPGVTLKDSIVLGTFLYHFLFLMSLIEISHLVFDNKFAVRIFVFLCTLFGGFDWVVGQQCSGNHFEWWQRCVFNGNTQISSFYTAMFWTPHHYVAFYAIVLAVILMGYAQTRRKLIQESLTLTVLASAFYCSPFSVMSFPFVAIADWKTIRERLLKSKMLPLVVFAMLVPLYIFLGKLPSQTFVWSTFRINMFGLFWPDKIISLPAYVLVVPLIEMAGIPLLLLFEIKRMSKKDKLYLLGAWLFFLSTYIVAYSNANNYCMRGMVLPCFLFYYLFAKYFSGLIADKLAKNRKSVVVFAVIIMMTLTGTLLEAQGKILNVWDQSSFKYRKTDIVLPTMYREIARNSILKTYSPSEFDDQNSISKYYAEKFIEPVVPVECMDLWEKEILRLPRNGWFF